MFFPLFQSEPSYALEGGSSSLWPPVGLSAFVHHSALKGQLFSSTSPLSTLLAYSYTTEKTGLDPAPSSYSLASCPLLQSDCFKEQSFLSFLPLLICSQQSTTILLLPSPLH